MPPTAFTLSLACDEIEKFRCRLESRRPLHRKGEPAASPRTHVPALVPMRGVAGHFCEEWRVGSELIGSLAISSVSPIWVMLDARLVREHPTPLS